MRRERTILNTAMMICLGLGFLSFVFGYLPDHFKQTKKTSSPLPKNMDDIVSFKKEPKNPESFFPPLESANEIIARFTPEPLPKLALPKPSPLPTFEPENAPLVLSVTPFTRQFRASSLATTYTPAATISSGDTVYLSWLEIPSGITLEVEFWKKIYATYSTNQVVMHDSKFLDIIYSVLDISSLMQNESLSPFEKQKGLDDALEHERNRIKTMLEKIQRLPTAADLNDEEWIIRKAFQKVNDPLKFQKAIDRIRGQKGLKDEFMAGLRRSGRFLGEIEHIFEEQNVPPQITRLIFVESMFQLDAHSSVGARGIWQMMHDSAHHYGLRVNDLIDERLDPIRSTHAAVKLLKDNYATLGNWPLAISAYNAGRGRLKGASEILNTRDIVRIIKEFQHPSYGFASRNFFPSFLAAYAIVNNVEHYFGTLQYDYPDHFDEIQLEASLFLPELLQASGISLVQIQNLNPMLQSTLLKGKEKIPYGTPIRLPLGKGNRFASAIRNLSKS